MEHVYRASKLATVHCSLFSNAKGIFGEFPDGTWRSCITWSADAFTGNRSPIVSRFRCITELFYIPQKVAEVSITYTIRQKEARSLVRARTKESSITICHAHCTPRNLLTDTRDHRETTRERDIGGFFCAARIAIYPTRDATHALGANKRSERVSRRFCEAWLQSFGRVLPASQPPLTYAATGKDARRGFRPSCQPGRGDIRFQHCEPSGAE